MKAVSLISTGIDSPVASSIMANKGIEVTGLNFAYKKENNVLKKLLKVSGIKECYLSDLNELHKLIPKGNRFRCILCKRFMYRNAERLAAKVGAEVIITGENIAQVASQTLDNLYLIENATNLPVLRPLLCYDKKEIVEKAKQINSYSLSIEKQIRCPFVPNNPATKGKLDKIKAFEKDMKLELLLPEFELLK